MSYCGEIGELVEISRIRTEELLIEWRIRDVLSLPVGSASWYASPGFRMGYEPWRLRLWPNWRKALNPKSGWLRLDVFRCLADPPKNFYFSVGIRGSVGVEKSREGEKEFLDNDYFYTWDYFCLRSELAEHKTRLMPNGVLTITCGLKRTAVGRGVSSSASIQNGSKIQEYAALDNGNQSLDKYGHQSSDECVICCETPADCALNPCGHMSLCYNCALQLWKDDSPHCPICRKLNQQVLKIYR